MAVRIGKLCGNGPRIWLAMQVEHDLWKAEREVSTKGIPTLKAAA
jgi:plasmid maintenance system antidote protein VapI